MIMNPNELEILTTHEGTPVNHTDPARQAGADEVLLQLTPDQFGPMVHYAGCWQYPHAVAFDYLQAYHQFLLIEKGRLEARTPHGPVEAGEHDLICFRPALENYYQVSGGTLLFQAAISFAPLSRCEFTPGFPELGPLPLVMRLGPSFGPMRALFETLTMELPQSGSSHRLHLQATVFKMLELIVNASVRENKSAVPLDAWERIHLRVISLDGGPFQDAELAGELGLSLAHFLRIFKRRFGASPQACRMFARLQEAVRRLRETDHSVKEIAYETGFDGAKGLSRALHRRTGLNASQIRSEVGGDIVVDPLQAPRPYPINQHVLPPGDTAELLERRARVRRHDFTD
ncbi:MAG: helix-turn-helix domain-containing protein [Verrucomicrobia bacterium]|nr:helix-turn-helix domain-containing protein [Verrucomicrobiota bacterium]